MPERPPRPRRSLTERIRRVFATTEQREAEDLEQRSQELGAEPIVGAVERSRVRFRGTVKAVTTAAGSGWLEAELADGTGSVHLVWMSRRRIEGILPGTHLVVSGRLAREGERRVIYNPDYEVIS